MDISNLTRYDLDGCGDHMCMCYAQMLEEKYGEYVKFDDVVELLKQTHNTASTPFIDQCPDCGAAVTYQAHHSAQCRYC